MCTPCLGMSAMLLLLLGFVLGAVSVLLVEVYLLLFSSPKRKEPIGFAQQFSLYRIPVEIKQLLLGDPDELKRKENYVALNVALQFLFQEFRDYKLFRRFILRKLQIEMNDLLSRTTVGRLVKDIKVRDFNVGGQFPAFKQVGISSVQLSQDKESFEQLDIEMDVDYRGCLEVSVDVLLAFGGAAFLSIKVLKLAGTGRLQLSRSPYTHWSFSYLTEPAMEFKVTSTFQGRPIPQLVRLIISQFKRITRKRHVLPAYKIRHRPFFINPLLQPSPDPSNYGHIQICGSLDVSVLGCSRLNLAAAGMGHSKVYCVLSVGAHHSVYGNFTAAKNSFAIKFVRHSPKEQLGLRFARKFSAETGNRRIVVEAVDPESLAGRAHFREGDTILAVNNIYIINETQATKLLSNTMGEMNVLIERTSGNTGGLAVESKSLQRQLLTDDEFVHICLDEESEPSVSTGVGPEMKDDVVQSESKGRDGPFAKSLTRSRSATDIFSTGFGCDDFGATAALIESLTDTPVVRDSLSSNRPIQFCLVKSYSAGQLTTVSTDVGLKGAIPRKRSAGELFNRKVSIDPVVSLVRRAEPKSDDPKSRSSLEFDQISIASSIGSDQPLSKREKLRATATKMASKTTDTVKTLLKKRRNLNVTEGVNNPAFLDPKSTEYGSAESYIRTSKSVESKLNTRVSLAGQKERPSSSRIGTVPPQSTSAIGSPGECPPEPNNNVGVDRKSADEQSSVDTDSNLLQEEDNIERHTRSLPLNSNPNFNEEHTFALNNRIKYINVAIWSKPIAADIRMAAQTGRKIDAKPTLLGYVNLYLPEVLDDCSITISHYHQEIYTLLASGRPVVWKEAILHLRELDSLKSHSGFDPRLCYGDIKLGFRWCPGGWTPNIRNRSPTQLDTQAAVSSLDLITAEFNETAEGATASLPEKINYGGHDWVPEHFTTATFCRICNKKIWLKTAFKCNSCSIICHKKCLIRSQDTKCSKDGLPFTQTATDVSVEDIVSPTEVKTLPTAERPETPVGSESHQHTAKRLYLGISERFSDLRRRRKGTSPAVVGDDALGLSNSPTPPPPKIDSPSRVAASSNPQSSQSLPTSPSRSKKAATSESQETDESLLDSAGDHPFHYFLFKKGGTYNEHIINAAKDLGKELFLEMPLVARKTKINEQIDKLQLEIDAATRSRLDLVNEDKLAPAERHADFQRSITNLDDKIQALAVLMLHYCAGLQHCIDLEESETSSTVGGVNLSGPVSAATLAEELSDDSSDSSSESFSVADEKSQNLLVKSSN